MKFLCIDYGIVRTGIAITDEGGRMAFPLCTIQCKPQSTRADFFNKLLNVITQEKPYSLVVGLPLLFDGQDSLGTKQVRNFVERLQRRTTLPIYFMPEALSSEEANEDLNVRQLRGKKRKAVLDQQAAVRILESFLALSQDKKELQKV